MMANDWLNDPERRNAVMQEAAKAVKNINAGAGGSMTREQTEADWATADEFWNLMQEIDPAKAKTIVTTLVASTPQTLEQARNVLRDASSLKG